MPGLCGPTGHRGPHTQTTQSPESTTTSKQTGGPRDPRGLCSHVEGQHPATPVWARPCPTHPRTALPCTAAQGQPGSEGRPRNAEAIEGHPEGLPRGHQASSPGAVSDVSRVSPAPCPLPAVPGGSQGPVGMRGPGGQRMGHGERVARTCAASGQERPGSHLLEGVGGSRRAGQVVLQDVCGERSGPALSGDVAVQALGASRLRDPLGPSTGWAPGTRAGGGAGLAAHTPEPSGLGSRPAHVGTQHRTHFALATCKWGWHAGPMRSAQPMRGGWHSREAGGSWHLQSPEQ